MPYLDVLVHRATPLRRGLSGEVIEGDADVAVTRGTPFDCCLFLPDGAEEPGDGRSRRVKRPMLLIAPLNDLGAPVTLSHEDELLIVAPELNAAAGLPEAAEVRYQVQGDGQPFGKPGYDIIGRQVTLARIEEGAPEQGVLE